MVDLPIEPARDPSGAATSACPVPLDDIPDAVLVADLSARLVWANRAAEVLFGRTLEECIGMYGPDLVHPDDLEIALLSLGSMQSERVGTPLHLRMMTASGWRHVEMIGSTKDGLIVMVVRDLTDRRRWEVAQDSESLLRTVLQHLSTAVLVVEPNGMVRASSAGITRMLGIGQERVESRHLTALVPGEHRLAVGRALHEVLAAPTGTTTAVDVDAFRADRSLLPVSINLVNLVDDPTVDGLVVTINDVSRRSQAEHDAREFNAMLSATLDSVSDGILAVDYDGRVRTYNRQYLELWAMPEELVRNHDPAGILKHILGLVVDPSATLRQAKSMRDDDEAVYEDSIELIDGRVIERRSRPRFLDGVAVGRVWSVRDVTSTHRLQTELARQALHDPLTGLANQVLFRRRLDAALDADTGVAAMFVDLDDFKAVNDTLGHSAGDRLLVEVAVRLSSVVRPEDTVARLGGDEFSILLTDVDSDGAIDVARRVMDALALPVELSPDSVVVGASVGVAVSDGTSEGDGLLRQADQAMYHAKRSGRNQFRIFTPSMVERGRGPGLSDPRLRGAGERGELVVHYQPIVDPLRGCTVVAAEALVRWMHPERGLVMPAEFIPYAESSGIIDELGLHVLAVACGHARQWQDLVGREAAPLISVNLSPNQLLDEHLPPRIAATLEDAGLDPDRLVLEFTEGALMQDPSAVVRQIRMIRRSGIHLAIDDFGTGHSSLGRLQEFPISSVKIDRSFVQHVVDRTGSSLVKAIVDLAHALGMVKVAEGVETELQQDLLNELGADLSQGYLHHRPMSAEDMVTLLTSVPASTSPLR